MGKCYICESVKFSKRSGSVRDNKNLNILECDNCGLVFLDKQDHINNQLYEDSGMHQSSCSMDEWTKNTDWDDQRRFNILKSSLVNKNLLDFGCGNANFLSKSKSICAQVSGIELEKRVIEHWKNRIKIFQNISDFSDNSFDIITAFHVVEHLLDPIKTLKDLRSKLKEGGTLIIEVPSSQDALLTLYECEQFQNFTYWSKHLYLFNQFTLEKLSTKSGFKVDTIKYYQRYPISNHLYWLSKGKPGGHTKWSFMDNSILNEEYSNILSSIGKTDTIIAYLKK